MKPIHAGVTSSRSGTAPATAEPGAGADRGEIQVVTETVPGALEGERVDRVVAMITGLARSQVNEVIDAGGVRLNKRVVASRSRRVRAAERVEVVFAPALGKVPAVADPGVEVAVLYEDESVIVVDKQAGLVVHPGAGNPEATLVHGLLARFPDLADIVDDDDDYAASPDRPGIVHRLDKGTSGLMVVARTASARRSLIAQLAAREVERVYWALVSGLVDADEGLIDAPMGRGGADPTRMTVRLGGREARTRYWVRARYQAPFEASLLECRLETGRTHQIRVHAAAIGHPVVGDARYGRTLRSLTLGSLAGDQPPDRGAADGVPTERPFLHAHSLAFDHPVSGVRLRFSSPLPADLEAVVDRLQPAET